MARQTRQQRRARRAESAEQARTAQPARRPPVADGDRPEATRARRPEPREARDGGGIWLVRFVHESIGELKKVEWPGQKQLIAGTTVVLIACLIVGAYLWANDLVWQRFVQNVLLK